VQLNLYQRQSHFEPVPIGSLEFSNIDIRMDGHQGNHVSLAFPGPMAPFRLLEINFSRRKFVPELRVKPHPTVTLNPFKRIKNPGCPLTYLKKRFDRENSNC
jgi:hypothetical protein